ncbi:hypothetical protein DFJ73DRAFT_814796 [Zopfochytrium polystomum]|nr:hypothetical protein DFJ73DRAFT_814796 [Zopfochytrium polystomum]
MIALQSATSSMPSSALSLSPLAPFEDDAHTSPAPIQAGAAAAASAKGDSAPRAVGFATGTFGAGSPAPPDQTSSKSYTTDPSTNPQAPSRAPKPPSPAAAPCPDRAVGSGVASAHCVDGAGGAGTVGVDGASAGPRLPSFTGNTVRSLKSTANPTTTHASTKSSTLHPSFNRPLPGDGFIVLRVRKRVPDGSTVKEATNSDHDYYYAHPAVLSRAPLLATLFANLPSCICSRTSPSSSCPINRSWTPSALLSTAPDEADALRPHIQHTPAALVSSFVPPNRSFPPMLTISLPRPPRAADTMKILYGQKVSSVYLPYLSSLGDAELCESYTLHSGARSSSGEDRQRPESRQSEVIPSAEADGLAASVAELRRIQQELAVRAKWLADVNANMAALGIVV